MVRMLLVFLLTLVATAQEIVLDDFESDVIGQLPRKWHNRDGNSLPHTYADPSAYQYRVERENGNRFLRYEGKKAKHLGLPIKFMGVDLNKTPVLRWSWRAMALPVGANESIAETNDAALSVYVVFKLTGIFRTPRSIRYTWSTSLPAGKKLDHGNLNTIVLRSGRADLGQWIREERNLIDDYKTCFGEDPPSRPLMLLILSDANDTDSFARGDYDDFIFGK